MTLVPMRFNAKVADAQLKVRPKAADTLVGPYSC